MARVKSKKFAGVYLNHMANGDISYSIVYKDESNITKRFTVGKKSNGITETFANAKRNEFINIIRLGAEPEAVTKRKKKNVITFDEVAQQFYEAKEMHNRNNTNAKRRYNLHVMPFLGQHDIKTITPDEIEKMQKAKSKTHAPKTVNHIINEASVIFNFAIEKEIITINPAKKIKRLSLDNSRERFLSLTEINMLLDAVRHNEQLYLFTKLALNTGGRVGAITQLQKKDIDLTHRNVTLKDEKNNSTYKAFIEDDELIALLQARLKDLKATDIILDYKEPGINKIIFRVANQLRPILDKLFNQGLKARDAKNRVVAHTLRHTFASHLAINGTSIFVIQKLMNHSDIKMTLRYAKLAPDSGRDAVRELYNQDD